MDNMMKLSATILLLFSSLLVNLAHSALITQDKSISLIGLPVTSGPFQDPVILDTFDPSIGVLNSVRITYSGQTTINLSLPASFNIIAFGQLVPASYSYVFNLKQNISGLSLPFDSELIYAGSAGLGQTNLYSVYDFSYDILLTEATDLLGITSSNLSQNFVAGLPAGGVVSPPVIFNQLRSDYEAGGPLTILSPTLTISAVVPIVNAIQPPVSGSIGVAGDFSVIYDYTPTPIPIPATIWLFGTAVIGLVGFSEGRKTA